jgi:hypothetical protein
MAKVAATVVTAAVTVVEAAAATVVEAAVVVSKPLFKTKRLKSASLYCGADGWPGHCVHVEVGYEDSCRRTMQHRQSKFAGANTTKAVQMIRIKRKPL